MLEPNYIRVSAEGIPAVEPAPGVSIWAIPGSSATLPAPAGHSVFFYTVRGAARIDSDKVPEHHLAQLGNGEGVAVSSEDGCLILYGYAVPIGEPVVAHGPFVINTREEFFQTLKDYQHGVFGDLAGLS